MIKILKYYIAIGLTAFIILTAAVSVSSASVIPPQKYHLVSHFQTYGNTSGIGDCTLAAAADYETYVSGITPNAQQVVHDYYLAGATSPASGITVGQLNTQWSKIGIAGTYAEMIPANFSTTWWKPQLALIYFGHGGTIYFARGQLNGRIYLGIYSKTANGPTQIGYNVYHMVVSLGEHRGFVWIISWGDVLKIPVASWNHMYVQSYNVIQLKEPSA